jgi:hypothetical protein
MWAPRFAAGLGVYPDFSSGLQVLAAAANYLFQIKHPSAAAPGFSLGSLALGANSRPLHQRRGAQPSPGLSKKIFLIKKTPSLRA